jgi:hypothetical protein
VGQTACYSSRCICLGTGTNLRSLLHFLCFGLDRGSLIPALNQKPHDFQHSKPFSLPVIAMSDPAAQAAVAAAIAAAVRTFNTELWTFYAFGVLITIVRTYARVKAVGIRDLRADDFIVWLAIVRIARSMRLSHQLLLLTQAQLHSCSTLRSRL